MRQCKSRKKIAAGSLIVLIIMMIVSCKKDDPASSNSWRLGHKIYNVIDVKKYPSSVIAYASEQEYIIFTFNAAPVISGTYFVASNGGLSTANEVAITFSGLSAASSYASTDHSGKSITVSVVDSSLSIAVPEMWMINSTYNDSLKFSASIHN